MSKRWQNRIVAVGLICLSMYLGNQARDFPARGGVFPVFSFACIILLSLLLLISTFFDKRAPSEDEKTFRFNWNELKPYLLFVLVIVQIAVMKSVGYFVSTGLFFISATLILGIRRHRTILYTLIIVLPLFYLFFEIGLKVELPQGVLF